MRDKEKHRAKNREWILKNRERAAANTRALRQRTADWVYSIKGEHCCKCGSKEKLEWDHINPALIGKSRGFKTMTINKLKEEIDNLQVLCKKCHLKKSKAEQLAAWNLFISLPLDEQQQLLLEYY